MWNFMNEEIRIETDQYLMSQISCYVIFLLLYDIAGEWRWNVLSFTEQEENKDCTTTRTLSQKQESKELEVTYPLDLSFVRRILFLWNTIFSINKQYLFLCSVFHFGQKVFLKTDFFLFFLSFQLKGRKISFKLILFSFFSVFQLGQKDFL